MDLRRLNMNKKHTFVHKYSFCVGFTLIYLSSFFNNGTFCYFCKAMHNVLIHFHSLELQVNRLSNLK